MSSIIPLPSPTTATTAPTTATTAPTTATTSAPSTSTPATAIATTTTIFSTGETPTTTTGLISTTLPTTTSSDAATPGPSSTAVSTTSSITTTPTSSNTAYVNIGPVVGGVVGGLVALVMITLIIFRFRRRGRGNRATIRLDTEPTVEPFAPIDVQQHDADQPSKHPTLQTTGSTVPAGLPPHQSGIGHSSTSGIINGGLSTHPHTDPSFDTFSPEALEPSQPRAPRVQQTQPILTDDQADFVNSLHANHVPAAAIARVMERMMAGERRPAIEGYAAAGGSLQPGHDHSHDSESAPPPSYDHVTSGE
ncbi:hypothetical protein BU15DRAFT_80690 [Melanogaster broomeanus]|nr:hypothetical protein BU15DRAFT_80690 [Melanogaster broomeanus]